MACIMSDMFETNVFMYSIMKEGALLVVMLTTGSINSAFSSSGL